MTSVAKHRFRVHRADDDDDDEKDTSRDRCDGAARGARVLHGFVVGATHRVRRGLELLACKPWMTGGTRTTRETTSVDLLRLGAGRSAVPWTLRIRGARDDGRRWFTHGVLRARGHLTGDQQQ